MRENYISYDANTEFLQVDGGAASPRGGRRDSREAISSQAEERRRPRPHPLKATTGRREASKQRRAGNSRMREAT